MTPAPSQSSTDTPANLSLFERLYTVLLPWIITRARRLSNGDRDLQDDLMQTGLQTLWEQCTPAVTTLDPDDIRADLYRAMVEYKRAERRASIIVPEWIRERDNADYTLDNTTVNPSNQTIRVAASPVAKLPSSADMPTPLGPVSTSRATRATSRARTPTARARWTTTPGRPAPSSVHTSHQAVRPTPRRGVPIHSPAPSKTPRGRRPAPRVQTRTVSGDV